MHADKDMQDCGAPPLLDGDWSGLNPPVLLSDKKVMGATTNVLLRGNRKNHHSRQEEQGPQSYWSTHEGKFVLPNKLPPPGKHRNKMCPSGLAVHNPVYETLLEYATGGCLVKADRNWTKD